MILVAFGTDPVDVGIEMLIQVTILGNYKHANTFAIVFGCRNAMTITTPSKLF